MAMIDPESLMFSLPNFKLPFDYCERLVYTKEQVEIAEKLRKMTQALKEAWREDFEKRVYEACFAPTKLGGGK